jgi:predicted ATPase
MATLFLQPKDLRPATIVLDEPEIGLHPDALVVLSEIIKAIANDGSQVIISTQSVALANCFEPDDFIVVVFGFIITQPLKTIKIIKRCYKIIIMYQFENNATYIKTQHAPIILQEIGLPKIRGKCQALSMLILPFILCNFI